MPIAVLDIDLQDMPDEINGLEAYSKALVLIRYKGKPVGKINLPIVHGNIQMKIHFDAILNAADPFVYTAWFHDHLDWDDRAVTDFTHSKASVAICTRDRPADLRHCLEALLQLPDDGQEILVIDNCPSSDATLKLVESYPTVRYICEPKAGLNHARNRALLEAKNEIIAFTDDDATPDPLWLRGLLKNFNHPMVLCVTGLTMPLELETNAQEAFESYSSFCKGFKRKVFTSATTNPLATGGVGAGANMALRKEVANLVGFFDPALDAGTPTESGGDHELFSRILLAGYQIVYDPQALSWHRHRRTWKETRKAIKGYGIGVYAFWTRLLVVEKEYGIVKLPFSWFIYTQFPNLMRAILQRPNCKSLNLVIAELEGCLLGPWRYFLAKKNVKSHL